MPTFAPNYITLDTNVSTIHRGKGFVYYMPTVDDEGLFLRISTKGNSNLNIELNITISYINALSFSINNPTKVVDGEEDLILLV